MCSLYHPIPSNPIQFHFDSISMMKQSFFPLFFSLSLSSLISSGWYSRNICKDSRVIMIKTKIIKLLFPFIFCLHFNFWCWMLNASTVNVVQSLHNPFWRSFYLFSILFFRNRMCDVNDECIVFGIILNYCIFWIHPKLSSPIVMRYLKWMIYRIFFVSFIIRRFWFIHIIASDEKWPILCFISL